VIPRQATRRDLTSGNGGTLSWVASCRRWGARNGSSAAFVFSLINGGPPGGRRHPAPGGRC